MRQFPLQFDPLRCTHSRITAHLCDGLHIHRNQKDFEPKLAAAAAVHNQHDRLPHNYIILWKHCAKVRSATWNKDCWKKGEVPRGTSNPKIEIQVFILQGFHFLLVFWGLVLITAKMQGTVKNHPVKLFFL